MKAVIQTRYGSIDDLELREVEKPEPGPGEVLVRVRAASVHPDVWHVVTGRPWILRLMGSGFSRPKNPIPGTDMAGVVEDVGRDVDRFRSGDEVFGLTSHQLEWANGGAYAEYVSAPEDVLAPKPEGVSFPEAASVPTAGYIALLNLRGGRLIDPGMKVLVNGAGGGVGSVALQVAKARGAHVTGVDHGKKLEMLRSLGADRAMDYTREDFTRTGERWDFIFDVPGNHSISRCKRALEPDGTYVLIGHEGFGRSGKPILGLLPLFMGIIARSLFDRQLRLGREGVPSRSEAVAILRQLLEEGRLTPVIDSSYPLEEIRDALRHMVEDELQGKVVITP